MKDALGIHHATTHATASFPIMMTHVAVATNMMDFASSRAERDKDFEQTIKQVKKFLDFARGYAGELHQMNQATI